MKYKLIGFKFSGRQLFNIHIGLQLTVKLFTGAMLIIQKNHFSRVNLQIRPVGINFEFRDQQELSILIFCDKLNFENYSF